MFFNRIFSYFSIFLFFCLIFAAIANAASEERIGLQNLHTRAIVYCYNNPKHSAEECASYYENKGYTRVNFYINDDISLAQKGDVVGRDSRG